MTREIRKKLFLTQESLAKELDVSISTIRSWEQKKKKPNITQQGKIAEFCRKHDIDFSFLG